MCSYNFVWPSGCFSYLEERMTCYHGNSLSRRYCTVDIFQSFHYISWSKEMCSYNFVWLSGCFNYLEERMMLVTMATVSADVIVLKIFSSNFIISAGAKKCFVCVGSFTAQSTTRSCRARQLIVALFLGRLRSSKWLTSTKR